MAKWWHEHPQRLEWEYKALREAGIRFETDDTAFAAGIARITAWPIINGVEEEFTVTFPELYPFFRFDVKAKNLNLEHHQNPFTKQLCLIGRATQSWDMTDSVAWMLVHQVPKVLAANAAAVVGQAYGYEERQAEPVSEFFPYHPHSLVLVDSSWVLESNEIAGNLVLGFDELTTEGRLSRLLRATVVKVLDETGLPLAECDARLEERNNRQGFGRWVRSDKPIMIADAAAFFKAAERLDPRPNKLEVIRVDEGEIAVRAVLFPEETDYRTSGTGWVVVVRFLGPKTKKGKRGGYYFARVGRYGRADAIRRAPELSGLDGKSISVFGLGCIGAPSALEFARAGVGHLAILDGDYLDPGTSLRWPFGLKFAGRPKVEIISTIIREHYPYTAVTPVERQLGAIREPGSDDAGDEDAMSMMTNNVSLIYDATAEFGVQYFLSEVARQQGVIYVGVAGKQGGWGGYIVRIVPGITEGCWGCLQLAWGHDIPRPPAAEMAFVQPAGCGDPTFLAAGFDMTELAVLGVRTAVSALHVRGSGYPSGESDVLVFATRDAEGKPVPPHTNGYKLIRHPECTVCGTQPIRQIFA